MHRIYCHHRSPGFFWFRVFGYGLHFKNVATHRLNFTERNHHCCRLLIRRWSIRFLS